MPQLIAVDDDGSMKFVGTVTKVDGPIVDEEDPEIETYNVTAEAFGTEYSSIWTPA